jgi:hypothetical protein
MKTCWPRPLLSLLLVLSFSFATFGADGADAPAAVLHASGKVQINGTGSRPTMALFSGDAVQTDEDSVANITARGSSVLVMPSASIKFLGKMVELREGGVSIATSNGMGAIADEFTVTPAAGKFSKFEVAENEDSVVIAARQGSVTVSDGQQTSTVPEGQETTRKKKKRAAGAEPGASGGGHFISGKTLAILGGASGATVAGILIAESNKKKKCVSSSNNKKCKCKKDSHGKEDCEED